MSNMCIMYHIFTCIMVKRDFHLTCFSLFCFLDGLVGMAIVGGIGLGLAGLAGLIGLAVAKKSA